MNEIFLKELQEIIDNVNHRDAYDTTFSQFWIADRRMRKAKCDYAEGKISIFEYNCAYNSYKTASINFAKQKCSSFRTFLHDQGIVEYITDEQLHDFINKYC
jgi:hypothetical protein